MMPMTHRKLISARDRRVARSACWKLGRDRRAKGALRAEFRYAPPWRVGARAPGRERRVVAGHRCGVCHPTLAPLWEVRFSNRPSGSSAFRLSTTAVSMSLTGSRFSSDSAPRPFHHGDSKTRWNNLLGGLAVSMTAGPSGQTNSPHPSSREGHHSTVGWSSISSYRI